MTDRPYTDNDLRAEAATCLLALSTSPSAADILRWLTGAYVESQRAADRSGPTWDDVLDAAGLAAVAQKIHDLASGAADVSAWAVNLGADGLEPTEHTFQLGAQGLAEDDAEEPFVRLHFAFNSQATDAERDRWVVQLAQVIASNL